MLSLAELDVQAERQKQVRLGRDAAHDDTHTACEIRDYGFPHGMPRGRKQMVRAAACLIAAIERLDRATIAHEHDGGGCLDCECASSPMSDYAGCSCREI